MPVPADLQFVVVWRVGTISALKGNLKLVASALFDHSCCTQATRGMPIKQTGVPMARKWQSMCCES